MPMRKNWIILFTASFILIALDLWFKQWAVANLRGQPDITVIKGVLGLTYVENPGALFGFLKNLEAARWILSALKVVILGGLLWYYNRLPNDKRFWLVRVPMILIFAGGAGNLVDRVINEGKVRDMLDFLFMNFAVFNLADVYVTVGVFCLIFVSLFIVKDIPLP